MNSPRLLPRWPRLYSPPVVSRSLQPSLPVRRGAVGEFVALERLFPGDAAGTAFLEGTAQNEAVRLGYPRTVTVSRAGLMRARGTGVGRGNFTRPNMSSRGYMWNM